MLTLKLQANDYELTLLPHKSKFAHLPEQSQDQILFQAEQMLLEQMLHGPMHWDSCDL